jgi:hypothetical protein
LTIFHLDGMDSYATSADLGMEYTVQSCTVGTTSGRFGAGAFEITSYEPSYLYKAVPSGLTTFYTGFAFNSVGPTNADNPILTVLSAAGNETTITLNTLTGVFKAWAGDLSSVIGTGVGSSVPQGTWHWIEIYFVLSASIGAVGTWVDGVQTLNISTVNTAHFGGTSIIGITIGSPHPFTSCQAWYDDWYILDPTSLPNNTLLNDSRIETLVPNSDAGPNNGTPSSGSIHYAMVDEAQWSSSNSLTLANTSGQEEIFGVTSLANNPTNVWAVRALNVVAKTDGGAFTAQSVIRSSSTTAVGASTSLLTTYSHIFGVFNQNPQTSAQWTVSAVNAANVGFNVT